jgi:CO/xanthine dehydrogenase FAD-binding subunit/thioredoxin reductase
MAEAGGMLRYSIPEYRLPKAVIRSQVHAFEKMGIKFEFGVRVGETPNTLQELRVRHQAVFLATGLWNGRRLGLENNALLDSGLEFLINVQTGVKKPIGKNVLVIGGGSVAVDVALTAKRLGAKQVTMSCLETRATMPAIAEDVVQAQEEGIQILPSWGPQRVVEQDGKLVGMELVRCTSVFDQEGRFAPVFDPQQKTMVEVDQVLVAIGQSADLSYAAPLHAERGMLVVDKATFTTNMEGVYAGGDVTGGSATVVHGMASGKKAAAAMDAYLRAVAPSKNPTANGKQPLVINPAALVKSSRAIASELPVSQRSLLVEDKNSLALEAVKNESTRCTNCGCVAVNASDVATALIALDAQVITTRRTLPAEELFAATVNHTTVLSADELIQEIRIPTPLPGSRQVYLKFRIRKAIDFPIVSVAFCATLRDGRYHDARVVMGAVAPTPMRAREVERLLEGQAPHKKLAIEAGNLAVDNVQPLARNKAKVEILKALVSKAIQMD